jgi:two-component system cell cycle response regulator
VPMLNPMRKLLPAAPRSARALLGLIALGCVGYAAILLTGNATHPTLRWVYPTIVIATAVSMAWRAVARQTDRAAWLLMAVAAFCWGGGQIFYNAFLANAASPPVPSVADAMWLAYYPFTAAALALLVRRRVGHLPRAYWLDAAIGVAATGAVGAIVTVDLVGAASSSGAGTLEKVFAAGYPIGDFVLLLLVVGTMILGGWRLSPKWLMIAGAEVLFVLVDTLYLTGVSAGTWTDNAIISTGWPIGGLLIAAAAWCRDDENATSLRASRWSALATPAVCAAMALVVLLWDHFRRLPGLSILLASIALVLLIARLAELFQENFKLVRVKHREARTDPLTGLANRRALFGDLERACGRDAEPAILALFDLNGFKGYNDTFGHPAGDALLKRLGHQLGTVTRELGGRAYRLGGDEFCALITCDGRAAADLALWSCTALEEHGQGFTIDASWGLAELPCAGGGTEALSVADGRMYTHKVSSRPSAALQSVNVLVAAEHERNPDLGDHTRGVAEMASEIATRLDLQPEESDRLGLAAELHDIGKIAIPDRILSKPGPLDAEEWAFMRRHTVIGARILLAGRDLQGVAPIVRSSHERWDGTGYPDGLAGELIPLGSRIVFVCDAFDAMIAERPYSAPLTVAEAIEEIKRCAGTQFDPAVVMAFDAMMTERRTLLSSGTTPRASDAQSVARPAGSAA